MRRPAAESGCRKAGTQPHLAEPLLGGFGSFGSAAVFLGQVLLQQRVANTVAIHGIVDVRHGAASALSGPSLFGPLR